MPNSAKIMEPLPPFITQIPSPYEPPVETVEATILPVLQEIQPTAKEKKYDRQLRLWAAKGQERLENSHVLLVVGGEQGSNSSVAGVEALKNLILPGIGSFTIADTATVTQADLGVNFFLEASSLGKPRAEETARFLRELNPDVESHFITDPLWKWAGKEKALHPYNQIIVCAPISREYLQKFSKHAAERWATVIYVHSVGFNGFFSIQVPPSLGIIDTHPDPESIQDLRLLWPWQELSKRVDALGNIDTLSDHDHGHIPYVLILLYYLRVWAAEHNYTYPSTFKDKTAFRELVASHARTNNPEGGEENFDEACAAVLKSINPPSMSKSCRELFEELECDTPTSVSANFWVLAHATKQFYIKHGVLPLSGILPDMKATSSEYIALQNLYKAKARADAAEVTATVREQEEKLHRNLMGHAAITDADVEYYCKNAAYARVLTNREDKPVPSLRLATWDEETIKALPGLLERYDTISPIFIAMNRSFLTDEIYSTTLASEEIDPEGKVEKAVQEFKRCQGAELHNTASVLGGMVAQEAIKLITRQYVPLENTCVWDGVQAKAEVFKL